jgi:lysyl-tRNA synthetase class 2
MWQPSATIDILKQRAKILAEIRQFFAEKKVWEVETPLLSHATVTDPHVLSIPATFKSFQKEQAVFLQTSPEYAMKRLLAAGSGSIYQITKSFRQGDLGVLHNPEFTMLEWYRVGFDHHALMNEMDELLQRILKTQPAEKATCEALYQRYIGLSPHTATDTELADYAKKNLQFTGELVERNAWLDLLFTHCIEPNIGLERPLFLYDFPVSQAALAKIRPENPPVASRFEVYFKGVELANGFHELQNPSEQRKRFEKDLITRQQLKINSVPIDENFLAALQNGLPDCAGVALGMDRLVMLALKQSAVAAVMSFDFNRA